MAGFKSIRAMVQVEISPRCLSNPHKAVYAKIASHILFYSSRVHATPLSFSIIGINNTGCISSDSGDVLISVLVEYIVFVLLEGDRIMSIDGRAFGIFQIEVDGDTEYTGMLTIRQIQSNPKSPLMTISGTRSD
ncbi:hypothetical protein CWI42_041950 [Ordospora colligata]|uniref:Uncharacterized protein n=1 Tax=Ordospora colligata OC4 TaxID=1354746 RepID=A0A0B2UFY0_9MICR|nr:uncharacterized protein M896_041960 [Ordospora colligata OC4]KHN69996.1 hypothetical protein M896_041960 [Ordospora colligata OC4]TBU16166.1 hypothetical protein CWI41_041950 [Ordospora colligata]TBU16379.1 hypothetical protein CWI40_041950 [Ordospora colligata]TBU19083.1 hypothetical protein CWI42_041950 [Ordospora colligata]